jgi:hypothetical protein
MTDQFDRVIMCRLLAETVQLKYAWVLGGLVALFRYRGLILYSYGYAKGVYDSLDLCTPDAT